MSTNWRRWVGLLGQTSKMPGKSYSLPAYKCQTGGRLQKVEGSVCHGCYAMKGCYRFPVVKNAMETRLRAIQDDDWVDVMADKISRLREPYFRWHDSGDIQSTEHLLKIFAVCRLTPSINHWLPTREYKYVKEALAESKVPPNLCIRISAHLVDEPAPQIGGLPTSTVHTSVPIGRNCPAESNGGSCGSCRACWDPNIKNISYHKH